MKHFAKIFAIITISLTATAVDCYKYDSDIAFTLHNDSDKTIGWYIPTYEEFLEGVMPDEMPKTLAKSHYHISPGKSHTFIRGSIPSEYQPDDLLKLYIFDIETLYDHNWEEVRDKGMYLYCFELSAEEVRKNGNQVSYPAK
ncbi:MAG: hypothetical protein K1V99_08350 [Bacteroidales bacterium]|nr:hypothetical protein [Bacteroidales bacterium]